MKNGRLPAGKHTTTYSSMPTLLSAAAARLNTLLKEPRDLGLRPADVHIVSSRGSSESTAAGSLHEPVDFVN